MNTTNTNLYKSSRNYFFITVAFLCTVFVWSQEPVEQDSIVTGFNLGNMQMPNPNSIESKYTYDPITDRYIYTEILLFINYDVIINFLENILVNVK